MRKLRLVCVLQCILLLLSSQGFCGVNLIKYDFYKDGGTKCLRYNKNSENIECCIDNRERNKGAGKIYLGGYPDTKKSRIISEKEVKSIHDDIATIMDSAEYKKYSVMSRAEVKSLLVLHDKQKMKEWSKALSYRSLKDFQQELLNRFKNTK